MHRRTHLTAFECTLADTTGRWVDSTGWGGTRCSRERGGYGRGDGREGGRRRGEGRGARRRRRQRGRGRASLQTLQNEASDAKRRSEKKKKKNRSGGIGSFVIVSGANLWIGRSLASFTFYLPSPPSLLPSPLLLSLSPFSLPPCFLPISPYLLPISNHLLFCGGQVSRQDFGQVLHALTQTGTSLLHL